MRSHTKIWLKIFLGGSITKAKIGKGHRTYLFAHEPG